MKRTAQKIDEWPDGTGPVLLVRKLRESAFPLTSKQILTVLEAIESTCPYCWDTDIGGTRRCTCDMDE